jgi:hypothetical protein
MLITPNDNYMSGTTGWTTQVAMHIVHIFVKEKIFDLRDNFFSRDAVR